MKKTLILTIIMFSLVLGGCTQNTTKNIKQNQQPKNQADEITRKDELQLEGFINDYFYRRQMKDSILFSDFDAYASVISKSIIVYVYPKINFSQARKKDVKEIIKEGLTSTLFDFSDFNWTNNYTFEVVIR